MGKIKEKFKSCPEVLSLIGFIVGIVAVTYFTNNFFAILSPFIVAYLVTRLMYPLMIKVRNKIKIPNGLNVIFSMIVFVTVAGLIVWLFGHYLLEGLAYLINLLSSESTIDSIIYTLEDIWWRLDETLKFVQVEIDISEIAEMVKDFAKNAITILSNLSINLAMKIPTLLLSLIIGGVAAFYMLFDYDNISGIILNQLSPKTRRFVDVFNEQALSSFIRMVLSYALVSAICFCELTVGFSILGIKDAAFIALLIAILDVLPVVGSGAILIPWGIASLLLGDTIVGIGVLVLYCVVLVVRQIVEPRIVGSQIGLHPLITIASLYIGLRLMGGLGLIMGPLYIIVCKKLNEEGLINLYKTKSKDSEDMQENDTEIKTSDT